MCARVKKHVEDSNSKKKLAGAARRKEKQTATAGNKLQAAAKNLNDITTFKACLLHRPGAPNEDRPCVCAAPPCKWLRHEICGNPACPEPVPKSRNCMKKLCKKWREDNGIPLVVFYKDRQPARPAQPRPAASRRPAPAGDGDSSEDEDGAPTGADLVGGKFLLSSTEDHAEGERLVTEPGVHIDEDTGEEFDMLWYQYHDPETDEVLDECSKVDEVREWVGRYDALI